MSKLAVLLLLPAFVLLAPTGCKRNQSIDATQYNAADWEKRIQAPSLTETEFTRLYALKVANEFKGCTVRITGKRELAVKFDEGGEIKAFLDNIWADVARDPTNRVEICQRYLKALAESQVGRKDTPAAPDTNSIVAVVRDDLFLQQFERIGMAKTNGLVTESLAADLHVVYVSDREGGMAYLTGKDQARLGLGLPALRQLALTNLHRILPPPKRIGTGPVFMLVADGNYESSLLLGDNLWDDQASAVQGELVAAVPSRDVLLFTGSASAAGLKEVRGKVEKIYNGGSHVISKTLLVRRNSRWVKFSD